MSELQVIQAMLEKIARRWDSPAYRVFFITPYQFIKPFHEHMKTGGHAEAILMSLPPEARWP